MTRFFTAALVITIVGCDKDPAPTPPASPSVSAPAASASIAPKPPHVGRWKGSAKLEPHRIQLPKKQGGIEAWQDAGSASAGSVALTVDIATDGNTNATVSGDLGKMRGSGDFEKNSLYLRLHSERSEPGSFAGVLTGKLEQGAIESELRISSGDSQRVWIAAPTLRK